MKTLKVAKRQLKDMFSNKIKSFAMIAIVIIPILYSFFYLKAYWDPYNNLSQYRVAVVNKDSGATLDGKIENYGKDIVDELKDNSDVGFEFVSESQANKGMDEDEYFAEFIIPENFSNKIATAKDGEALKAEIKYISNDKKNYIGSKISDNIKSEIKSKVQKSVSENYGKIAIESIYKTKDGLKDAKDGTKELLDGEKDLAKGGKDLNNGLGELNDKVPELSTGITKLQDGSNQVTNGLGELNSKLPVLTNGMSQLVSGSNQVTNGLGELNSKLPALTNGMPKLVWGSNQVTDGLGELNRNLPQLTSGMPKLVSGSNQVTEGLEDLNSKLPTLTNGMLKLGEGSERLSSGVSQLKSKAIDPLVDSTPKIQEGLEKLKNGSGDLVNNVNNLKDGANKLTSASKSVSNGTNELIQSMTNSQNAMKQAVSKYQKNPTPAALQEMLQTLNYINNQFESKENQEKLYRLKHGAVGVSNGIESMASELNSKSSEMDGFKQQIGQLYAGGMEYTNGVKELGNRFDGLQQGAIDLNQGLNEAGSQIPALASGAAKLYAGSNQVTAGLNQAGSQIPALASGAAKLYDGSSQVTAGLNQAGSQIPALASGATKLYDGSSQVTNGLNQANSQIPALASGAAKLYDGSSQVTDGLNQAGSQMPELATGVNKLYDGSGQLKDGLDKAYDGTKELKDGLDDGYKEINDKMKTNSDDLGSFIGEPVKMVKTAMNPVDNYGTGLAPYFLPISVWIGAVFIFLIVKNKKNDIDEYNNAQLVFGKYLSCLLIGLVQAGVLGIVALAMGINPTHPGMLMVLLAVMSISFVSILYCLTNLGGLLGESIAIVLLILQLCSDSGTFPKETLPAFFQGINPILPFTYAVEGLRESISAVNMSMAVFSKDLICILLFGLGAMVINIALSKKSEAIVDTLEENLAA